MTTPAEERVLYYAPFSEEQDCRWRRLLEKQHLHGVRVQARDLNRTVGALAGLDREQDRTDFTGDPPDVSVIVMADLDDDRIRQLLASLQEHPDLHLELKAVRTEHNVHWPFIDLIRELRQEHQAMRAYAALQDLTDEADIRLKQHTPSAMDASARALASSARHARDLLTAAEQQGEFDADAILAAGKDLWTRLRDRLPDGLA